MTGLLTVLYSQIHMRDFPLNALMETRTSLFLTFVRYFAFF